MKTAPEPRLGIESQPETGQNLSLLLQGVSRAAMCFSATSVLLMLGVLVVTLLFGDKQGNRGGMDFIGFRYDVPLLFFCLIFLITGFLLGVFTKKTRTGRLAIVTAFAPFVIGALIVVGYRTVTSATQPANHVRSI